MIGLLAIALQLYNSYLELTSKVQKNKQDLLSYNYKVIYAH